jgi:hypothetical protein
MLPRVVWRHQFQCNHNVTFKDLSKDGTIIRCGTHKLGRSPCIMCYDITTTTSHLVANMSCSRNLWTLLTKQHHIVKGQDLDRIGLVDLVISRWSCQGVFIGWHKSKT